MQNTTDDKSTSFTSSVFKPRYLTQFFFSLFLFYFLESELKKNYYKMTVICTKCKKIIGNKQFLTCNLCKYNFHLECTEVTFQRYRIMTTANKKAYKCMACSSRMQIQNASTPNSIGSTSSPASSCFTFQESDNITQRNKQRINVPTENSFQELTTEEAKFGSPASSPLTQKK